ncbi:MAG: aldo/keto reductase [Candidatus Eisenbacteria bacterium]|nr:aldo/keto reductase [Candidatus Eisenbacteria bacterium]
MEQIELRGRTVPALGLGTWRLTGTEARRAIAAALEIGYRHIDTARRYENEREVGAAIAEAAVPRSELFLTTKVWWEDLHAQDLRQSVAASCEALRTDYLDLVLIHWPNFSLPLKEPISAMERLAQEGVIHLIGVSNFPPDLLRGAIAVGPVACDQVEYHPYLGQLELLDICQEHDLMLTAYAPIARAKVLEEPRLQQIGRKYDKDPIQVTLRWLLQQERVAAIPKAADPQHLRSNFDVFDFELEEDEMLQIHGLRRGERLIDPGFAPQWER